ncbi:serine/threonine protein kinase, partial [Pyxidicoccus fallax]|nr:serine/threonine protein kinase [Pyxidicoccus fallax]
VPRVEARPPVPPPPPPDALPELPELDLGERTEVLSLKAGLAPEPPTPAPQPRPSQPALAPPPRASQPAMAPPPRASTTGVPAQGTHARAPAPTRPSVAVPAVPELRAVQPPAARPPAKEADAPATGGGGKWKWLALGGGGVLVLAVVALVMLRGPGSAFVNVEPGEHVYVGGVRMEEGSAPLDSLNGPLLISTAVDGKLRRFGTTRQRDGIDVRTLATAAPQPGTKGLLSVTGSAPGCQVQVGGAMLPGVTPLAKTPIDAGRELEVLVNCQGSVDRLWVMAVPGQEIEVAAR